ncbi:MAG: peroxiredoxin-like family protein [Pseudomonadota bacterium]
MLIPDQAAPALNVPTIAHGAFDLASARPERMTLVNFYRGLHCPICAKYLAELEEQAPAFAERGVDVIAVSTDPMDRAQGMVDKISAKHLKIGYDLPLHVAKEWGLYLSQSKGATSIGIEESPIFAEPGLFLVRNDNRVFYASVQSMPFARPKYAELVGALDFVIANDYPARGTYTGAV